MSQQHPAHSDARKEFRDRFSLRLVAEKEEGLHITKQPEGVYGFTASPSSEELPLFIAPTYQCFEVHKLRGGEVVLVGYMTEEEFGAVQTGAEPVFVNLYPEPQGESVKLAGLPLSRIDQRKAPSRDGGNWMRVLVAPERAD